MIRTILLCFLFPIGIFVGALLTVWGLQEELHIGKFPTTGIVVCESIDLSEMWADDIKRDGAFLFFTDHHTKRRFAASGCSVED